MRTVFLQSLDLARIDMEACPMSYGVNGKPHALAGVSNAPDYISAENLTVTYTDFRKINTLTEGNKTYTLTYGVDDQRRKSVFTQGAATTTRYYLGDYEEVQKSDGTIQKIHYLRGGSMMLQQGATKSLYYGYHDYQGSLIVLTNQSGTVVERRAYDPWGRHRNPQSWTDADYTSTSWLNNRGYTGHEHLDAFQIININGRVYDPLTAQFFSPDPYVQAPDNWLNYNRYGYCLNNPLIYTDPSGENPLLIAGIFLFLISTDPGYEIQKYLSPFAFKVDYNFGTHENKLGFDISYGAPKILPYATRKNYGKTYYWKHISSDYKGWETREGKETSYFWLYHEGETKYLAGKFSQTVGFRKYGIPSILGLDVYNDCWGDKGDRFRTSTIKINLGGIGFENTLFTGDPGLEERYINTDVGPNGTYYYDPSDPYATDPNAYRAGVFAIRIGPFSIGLESEKIRAFVQNGYHNLTDDPYFEDLSDNPNYPQYHKWRFYFQFGW